MIMGWLFATMGSPARAVVPAGSPAISNIVATYYLDGSGCGESSGAQYSITWDANGDVIDGSHNVKIYIDGGGTPTVTTQTSPQTVQSVTAISAERNDYSGVPITYSISYELINTAGPTVIQSGAVTSSPNSSILDITTECAV